MKEKIKARNTNEGPSAEVKIRVLKRDRFRCTYCGVPGTDAELEIDHIIAVARGGSHHISNLTTACRKCNQQKSDRDAPARWKAPEKPADKPAPPNGIIGLFMHDFAEAGLRYQGRIVDTNGDMAFVQLFSWMDGSATNIEPIPIKTIFSDKVKLYASCQEMNSAYEKYARATGAWVDEYDTL